MMAACDMTLEGGTSGRPTCLGDKSQTRARDPLFFLEDPNEGRLVHRQACYAASFRCQGGKM